MSKTSLTIVGIGSVGVGVGGVGEGGGVVDEGGGGRDDAGGTGQDGGLSVTPPPLNNLRARPRFPPAQPTRSWRV